MTRRRQIYYKLVGKIAVPATLRECEKQLGDFNSRMVARTEIGPLIVSTIFLGIDHNFGFGPDKDPLLFETMIFGGDERSDFAESYCERYHTWGEAEAGHAQAVILAESMVTKATAEMVINKEIPSE